MATDWYLKLADRELGPFTGAQLKAMAERGQIAPFDPVRRGEQGGWIAAGCVKGLLNGEKPSEADVPGESSRQADDPPPQIAVVPSRARVADSSRGVKRRTNANLVTVLVVALVFVVACVLGFSTLNRPMAAPQPVRPNRAEPSTQASLQPVPPSQAVELDLSIVDELTGKTPVASSPAHESLPAEAPAHAVAPAAPPGSTVAGPDAGKDDSPPVKAGHRATERRNHDLWRQEEIRRQAQATAPGQTEAPAPR
jgi:hypothetical protein